MIKLQRDDDGQIPGWWAMDNVDFHRFKQLGGSWTVLPTGAIAARSSDHRTATASTLPRAIDALLPKFFAGR